MYEQEEFLQKCHEGYTLAIPFLRSKGRNIIEIDGEGNIEEVHDRLTQFFIQEQK